MRVVGTCVAVGIAFTSLSLHGCAGPAETHAEANSTDANSTDANSTDANSTDANSTHAEAPSSHSEPPTTLPPLPPAYYALEKGACCCPKEEEVKSIDMCHKALHVFAAHLGFDTKEAEEVSWNGTDEHIPPGCSFKVWPDGKTGRGHWNYAETGKSRDNMIPICHNTSAEGHSHATVDHTSRLFDASIRGSPASRVAPPVAFLAGSMLVAAISLAVIFRRGTRLGQWSAEDATHLIAEDDEGA